MSELSYSSLLSAISFLSPMISDAPAFESDLAMSAPIPEAPAVMTIILFFMCSNSS